MADVNNQVYLHIVWATYDREPYLTPEIWEILRQCIDAVGKRLRCQILAIGGIEDHIHVLLQFATTVSIADLLHELKGYSSHVINERFPESHFKWQGGYGVFPVGPNGLDRVEAYIKNQKEHHMQGTTILKLENMGFTPKAIKERDEVAHMI
jgi:putative transposase